MRSYLENTSVVLHKDAQWLIYVKIPYIYGSQPFPSICTMRTPDITDSPHKNIILIFIILTPASRKGNKDICVQYYAYITP